ncbi:GTP-binding protein [Oxalobacteraceae bacterium R-40]|uniref:GTP-binding protein n=1 Tax=Keguizhuia sedimenti TaxID=3064264 RepID=A0ABU1BJQ1_9BURK|nr:GTP-binding protein [Oxalobacteraceae bacterium R-40]
MALIPTTILTGFLGSGKTTLLKRILQEPHGHKIAVIENEFGEESIDNDILIQDSKEQIVEMNNGCICCTVRGDLIMALTELSQKRNSGLLDFDHVIIETTGLANPGPVAQTFFMDEEVAVHYLLDSIITVVDAKHGMQQLDAYEEAQRQVGFADRLLLSKTDLVDEPQANALKERLKRINPRASVHAAHFGEMPIAEILDIRGFNLNEKLHIDPEFLADEEAEHVHHDCSEHCDHHDHDHSDHSSQHTDGISAFAFKSTRPFDVNRLDEFLGYLVQVYGPNMLRYKGVLFMDGGERKVVFQGVHQMMGTDIGAKWEKNETRESKMVFIGKDLPKSIFISGLEQCLV